MTTVYASDALLRQAKAIRSLKRCCWYMFMLWVITVASCTAVLVTGKLPLIEIATKQPDFGSAYSR